VTTAKKPESDPQRAARAYDRDNLEMARRAIAEPDKYPHLVEWAKLFMEGYEKK
jgi:hypothetical protein